MGFNRLVVHGFYDPVDTERKLNVHMTFRRRPGRRLNVLCTFNLRPVSTGDVQKQSTPNLRSTI